MGVLLATDVCSFRLPCAVSEHEQTLKRKDERLEESTPTRSFVLCHLPRLCCTACATLLFVGWVCAFVPSTEPGHSWLDCLSYLQWSIFSISMPLAPSSRLSTPVLVCSPETDLY